MVSFVCGRGTIFFTNFNGQTGIKTLCAQSMLYIHRNHCQKEFKQCFYFRNFLILHVICTKKEANKFFYSNNLGRFTQNQSNVYTKCRINHFILGKTM